MASIVGKKVSGQTYYYLREMARVGGKPRMVSERYLGKAADIEAAMAGATVEPERTRHLGFGDLAGVWSVGVAQGTLVSQTSMLARGDGGGFLWPNLPVFRLSAVRQSSPLWRLGSVF